MVSTVTVLARLGCFGGHLQRGQRAAGVARRQLHQQVDGSSVTATWPPSPRGSSIARLHHGADGVGVERLQLQDQRPRQQRRDDGERRVLGGRRDQQHDPVLDGRQQRVLLGLGEPVHLVDEQHGLLAVRGGAARDVDDGADLLDAGRQRRQRLEPAAGGLRDQRRQRGLAGARRAVEDDRRRARALDQAAQRRTRPAAGGPGRPPRRGWPAASAPPAEPMRRRVRPRLAAWFAGDVKQTVGHALCLPRRYDG